MRIKIAVLFVAVMAKRMSIVLDLKNFTRKIRWLMVVKMA
jgi:hypothetical protein